MLNDDLIDAIAALTRAVVGSASHDEIRALLYRLGRAAKVDVVAVTENIDGPHGSSLANVVHWVDADAPFFGGKTREHLPVVDWSLVPGTEAILSSGKFHRFESLDDLDPIDRQLYTDSPAQLRSGIELPILVGGRWAGHVLLSNRTEGRRWSDTEILILQAITDVYAGAWERDRSVQLAEAALASRNNTLRHQQALTECSRVLLSEFDDTALENALRAISGAFGHGLTFHDRVVRHEGQQPRLIPGMALTVNAPAETSYTAIGRSDWPQLWHSLERGRIFKFSSSAELDMSNDLARCAVRRETEAILAVPIMINARFEGVIGVMSREPWDWTETEQSTLVTTAAMLGSFLERKRTLDRLQDLVRAKDQFVASVSHEIRTPMTVVFGLASELSANLAEFEAHEVREFIDLIVGQTHDIVNLVEDLLVAARIDAGITVIPAEIEINSEIERVVEALPQEAAAKTSQVRADECVAWADGLRTRQILRNLILNAHRHGGPHIEISVEAQDNQVAVVVTDDGPGIESESLTRIFEAYESDAAASGRPGSIGLGLTVSRDLAALMNGSLSVSSEPGWTSFTLRLPRRPSPVPPEDD